MNELSFGALPSLKDKRTIKAKTLTLSGVPYLKGGIDYLPEDIEHQSKVGICTAIWLTQNRAKANGRKYSADFQYLLEKKFYDLNWTEGSSILVSLKVGKNYGFLPAELWTYTTQEDRDQGYDHYIAKLQAIPDTEIYRLISLCVDKIAGYAQVDVNDAQSLAKAIVASQAGLGCMYLVGKEWYTDINGVISWLASAISPLRPPKQVISGHAITMNKFDYTQFTRQTLANTWSALWANKGTAEIDHDNYKPLEAWLITTDPVINKFTKDIRFLSSGNNVVNLQNALKIKGFFNYNSTGYFGPLTLSAVKAFQKANNIPSTGFVGPLTRECLNKLFNL